MTSSTSYHRGELAAQDRAGTRGAAAELALVKRDALNFSKNHDVFLAAQSFAVISSVDLSSERIWVTPLFAKEGDLTAVSEKEISLSSDCIPEGDVLRTLPANAPLSLMGIDLNRRIRHRINGHSCIPTDKADTRLKHTIYTGLPVFSSVYRSEGLQRSGILIAGSWFSTKIMLIQWLKTQNDKNAQP